MTAIRYPKRLIEVDLPIKRISAHARREKCIRHGHISTLHIWWARRPLAVCRAVLCASLWPDPADDLCPEQFKQMARELMLSWAKSHLKHTSNESHKRFVSYQHKPDKLDENIELRKALLDFIADFSAWESSTNRDYLDTARKLTQCAHESLSGISGTLPLVVDPFAGGGSIPLEALRIGADVFSSDLNPVAVFLNKTILQYIPRYRDKLADDTRKWGSWIRERAYSILKDFYPLDANGARPIAYFWSRVAKCEGPGCGVVIPLRPSFLLAQKSGRKVGIILEVNEKSISSRVVEGVDAKSISPGTVSRGAATCPCCGYTTPAINIRKQFNGRGGGANDAILLAIASVAQKASGRIYRSATEEDVRVAKLAHQALRDRVDDLPGKLSSLPTETLPYLRSIFNIKLLDVNTWGDLFSPRQSLTLLTFADIIKDAIDIVEHESGADYAAAVESMLACAFDRQVDYTSSLCTWWPGGEKIQHTFGRQALPIFWDFAEVNPFSNSTGSWKGAYEWGAKVCEHIRDSTLREGQVQGVSATKHPLPDDCVAALVTDPPYYDLVPYADLSDFFYVWLKRLLRHGVCNMFTETLSPKKDETVQLAERNKEYSFKTKENYESLMREALSESRREVTPNGIGIIFFAHKGTGAWESQLQAMIDAGWIITASWPIDTEMATRLRAMNSAVLASSIQLVCRPRKNKDGSLRIDDIGDWRKVLQELPVKIHEWMPRLAEEGVVGADAIFACLGPALEIYSRYSKVEKASGDEVSLKEYLEHVWAAVAKEALNMIFEGADATGFEEDARLTAMWLWTLSTSTNGTNDKDDDSDNKTKRGGFSLEYDAARKIAQGLGAHLDKMTSLVEIKGDIARLLPVNERSRYLFGKESPDVITTKRKKIPQHEFDFMKDIEEAEQKSGGFTDKSVFQGGITVLDQIHQAMLLFAAGRGEAVKRFLVEDGAGRDQRFWTLAQALSTLYPSNTDEKRWVDGILARKKGLGF